MQRKSLLTLSSLTIIFGAIANQSSLASQLKQGNLVSSTTSSQLISCTSTNINQKGCASINDQSVPSSSDRTNLLTTEDKQLTPTSSDRTWGEGSSTKTDPSAESTTQDEGINRSDRAGSSFEQQSNEPNSSTSKGEVSMSAVEQEVHDQINQYRAKKGLSALTLDNIISEQARKHSQKMASGAVAFSHDGFEQRVKAIALTIPYTSSAENVAYNQGFGDPATQAVKGWLNSSGHLKNIQGNYNQTGIGVAKNTSGEYYLTQIFLRTP